MKVDFDVVTCVVQQKIRVFEKSSLLFPLECCGHTLYHFNVVALYDEKKLKVNFSSRKQSLYFINLYGFCQKYYQQIRPDTCKK